MAVPVTSAVMLQPIILLTLLDQNTVSGGLSGSAAAGETIVGTVTIKDSSQPSIERSVTIAADGKYAIDISGLTAPFMLRAVGTIRGRSYSIYSAAVETDVDGTINVTPFTDLIVANVAGQTAATLYQSDDFSMLTSAALNAAESALQARLQPVLAAVGVNSIDLLRTPFSADGTGISTALGLMRVTIDATTQRATVTNDINDQKIIDDLTIQSDATALTDTGGIPRGLTTLQSGCDVLAYQPLASTPGGEHPLKHICPDSLPATSIDFEPGLDGKSRIAKLTNALTGNVSTFSYDSQNQLAAVVTRNSANTLLATTTFEIGVTGTGRVATQTNTRTGNVSGLSYDPFQLAAVVTRDSAGTLLVTTTLERGLDGLARVARQTNARTGNVTDFSYGSSNRLETVVTHDSAGSLLVTTTFEMQIDGSARVANQTNARTGNVTSFSYSSGLLVTVVTRDSAGIPQVTTTFEGGLSGVRRVRTVYDHQTGRLSTYVYDASNRATVSIS
jgi:hypothetical protein